MFALGSVTLCLFRLIAPFFVELRLFLSSRAFLSPLALFCRYSRLLVATREPRQLDYLNLSEGLPLLYMYLMFMLY